LSEAPVVKHIDDLTARLIAPQDTVKLVALTGPSDGSPTSVFFEIWEPSGSQPKNSHPDSVEIFLILNGTAEAHSDEHVVTLRQGDVIVLPKGSTHTIRNTSDTERLYAVTIMATDNEGSIPEGFEHLVTSGLPTAFDDDDKRAIYSMVAS
jgi:mannose-6-phosphate isomerase-like protein (cupin superfamily)